MSLVIDKFVAARMPSAAYALLVSAVIGLSGCAQHTWIPGPGRSASEFEPTSAQCRMAARNGGGGFVAVGRPAFVAGAALGNAIGQGIRAQNDFNDCMSASGFLVADGITKEGQADKAKQLKAILAENRACVTEVRNQSKYAALASRMADINTGKHSMVQISDPKLATLDEATLLAAYIDETEVCTARNMPRYASVSTGFAELMQHTRNNFRANATTLIRHQQSWGDYSQKLNEVSNENTAKLKQIVL